ncbi:MAG TPA: response regulator [Albitalea sp.]|nr:response regulator [Albitalea sp.]
MAFDFAELFTASARHVMPLAMARKLRFSFDYHGPQVTVAGDAPAMRCSLHRLWCALIDTVDVGFLVFYAQAAITRSGRCLLTVKAAGTGLLAADEVQTRVLERLQMDGDALPPESRPRLRRASGRCPATGAQVQFASLPIEGVLFSAEWLLPLVSAADVPGPLVQQARAWVIHDDEVGAESLVRRLQRQGFATSRFDSPTPAERRLQALGTAQAQPALVIAVEGPSVTPGSVRPLRERLSDAGRFVYGVLEGSPTLAHDDAVPGCDVQVYPFSPADLQRMSLDLAACDPPSGDTLPAPLLFADRPRALVVDDNEIARLASSAMLESLGYETCVASDGVQAIAECERSGPAVVLMDLWMPRMDGLVAAARLRELQRVGRVTPARIIATTADDSIEMMRACLAAGMDGHLVKPLLRAVLRAELRRVCTGADAPKEAPFVRA